LTNNEKVLEPLERHLVDAIGQKARSPGNGDLQGYGQVGLVVCRVGFYTAKLDKYFTIGMQPKYQWKRQGPLMW
jgi:hypothetical protein